MYKSANAGGSTNLTILTLPAPAGEKAKKGRENELKICALPKHKNGGKNETQKHERKTAAILYHSRNGRGSRKGSIGFGNALCNGAPNP
jgi:hypothetical protein